MRKCAGREDIFLPCWSKILLLSQTSSTILISGFWDLNICTLSQVSVKKRVPLVALYGGLKKEFLSKAEPPSESEHRSSITVVQDNAVLSPCLLSSQMRFLYISPVGIFQVIFTFSDLKWVYPGVFQEKSSRWKNTSSCSFCDFIFLRIEYILSITFGNYKWIQVLVT